MISLMITVTLAKDGDSVNDDRDVAFWILTMVMYSMLQLIQVISSILVFAVIYKVGFYFGIMLLSFYFLLSLL